MKGCFFTAFLFAIEGKFWFGEEIYVGAFLKKGPHTPEKLQKRD